MTSRELDEDDLYFADLLAGRMGDQIIERLSASVMSSVIPADIGELIRRNCQHGTYYQQHIISFGGPDCLFAGYELNPDGTILMRLMDECMRPFWSGTFRPAVTP